MRHLLGYLYPNFGLLLLNLSKALQEIKKNITIRPEQLEIPNTNTKTIVAALTVA